MKWIQRIAAVVGVVLLLWGAAWLAIPPLVKWQAQTRLTELLGRSVTLGEVSLRPWALELTVKDLIVGAAAGTALPATAPSASGAGARSAAGAAAPPAEPLLNIARIRADIAFWPLFTGLPVVEALDVDGLRLRVTRLAPGHYDVDDLIERFGRGPDRPATAPPQFALYNLQLRDAQLRFDDRPVGRVQRIEDLQLALPFLSNRPAQVAVMVTPHLAFKLNGASFDSSAKATPFAPDRRAVLELAVDDLDLGPYLGYLPRSLPVHPVRGVLSADLKLAFDRPQGGSPSVSLQGWVGARDLALSDATGAPLLESRRMRLGLRDVQPLSHRLAFNTLRIEGATLHLARDAQGRLNLLPAASVETAGAPPPPRAASSVGGQASQASGSAQSAATAATAMPAAPPWQVSLGALEFVDARLLWSDAAIRPVAALQLDDLSLAAQALQWPMARPASLSLAATLRAQAAGAAPAGRLTVQGTATDRDASLDLGVSDLALGALAPYLAQVLTPRIDGRFAARAKLDWSADAKAPHLRLAIENANLDALRIEPGGGRAAQDGATLARLALADAQVDVLQRSATLGSVEFDRPSIRLARDASGKLDIARWWRAPSPTAGAAAPRQSRGEAGPAWRLRLHRLALEDGRIGLADARVRDAHGRPVRAELQRLNVGLQDLSWADGRVPMAAKLQLSARLASAAAPGAMPPPQATLDWKGEVGLQPLRASGSLHVVRFPAQLLAPYFAADLPVNLVRADAGYTGRLSIREQPAGLTVSVAGDALLGDVQVSTRPDAADAATLATGADELLSWQSLALKRLKFEMRPGTRPHLEIGAAALADLYSHLVVTAQGRFNLQEVREPAPAAPAKPAQPAGEAGAVAAAASAATESPAAAPSSLPLDLRIGATTLTNGRIDFADHFVQPNYSAALTELDGTLGPFSSDSGEMATLHLQGRAAGTALLDINGRIDPTVRPPRMDIQARASDLELAPLSPYAGKYAGYAIERGKLSLNVAYRIDADGKLQATNQLVLNQLTFGERVDSPSATRLPVLLAVALLKDRHGVIDINLPISGSLNDPKFSVGGIIFRLIVNLIAKALTAPFTLLAGGGGQDLSTVAFAPGTAVLAENGASAIEKVAKALTDRPALHMTVTGMADAASERAAYQRAAIEARLLAERRREGLRAGAAANAPVTLGAEDRARLLKALYRQTDLPDKPRNALGFAKDIPVAEMETLLRRHVPVTEQTLRELALQRGLAVRDALIAKGLDSQRLFVAAPKLHEAGGDDAGWTPQAQLSLSLK